LLRRASPVSGNPYPYVADRLEKDGVMSFASLLWMLAPHVPMAAALPPRSGISGPAKAAIFRTVTSTVPRQQDRRREYGLPRRDTDESWHSLDLALNTGSRHRSAELELGALGGGRADAPALVHVGVGFDF
jgi:hypothetical protein